MSDNLDLDTDGAILKGSLPDWIPDELRFGGELCSCSSAVIDGGSMPTDWRPGRVGRPLEHHVDCRALPLLRWCEARHVLRANIEAETRHQVAENIRRLRLDKCDDAQSTRDYCAVVAEFGAPARLARGETNG